MTLDGMPEADRAGLLQLLDLIAEQDFNDMSQLSREQVLQNMSLASMEAAGGVAALQALTFFFTYGITDERGQNPAFATFGYPGRASPTPDVPKPIAPIVPEGDTTIEADAVGVGSGAGGSVIAAKLARAGLKVLVLEAGGLFKEAELNQGQEGGAQKLYWRGGPSPDRGLDGKPPTAVRPGGGSPH